MKIITGYQEFKDIREELSEVSFIPTMGNLHAGHMSLLERAKTYNNHISVSIFINPLQFNDKDDYINWSIRFVSEKHPEWLKDKFTPLKID